MLEILLLKHVMHCNSSNSIQLETPSTVFEQMMSAVVAVTFVAVSDVACELMFADSVYTECVAPARC